MNEKATMATRGFKIGLAVLALAAWAGPARAQVGAKVNGNWGMASIWTTNSVPGSSDNVYIGSNNTPAGAAATATVTLTANESANNLNLGYGSASSKGTLDLGANTLTVSGEITLGYLGGTGSISEAGGSFTAGDLFIVGSNSYSIGANDAVGGLILANGASATTTAGGNVTGYVEVQSGSTFNMGAALNTASVDVTGSGSVLNMNGHAITGANEVLLGYNGSSAITIDNRAAITTTNLYVGNGMAFNLSAADSVTNFNLGTKATSTLSGSVSSLGLTNAAVATTTAAGNVTGNVYVDSGSTFNMGAALNISGALQVQESGSTINAQGHGITSNQLFVGYYGTSAASLTNAGTVTTNELYVGNGSALTLHGGDVINNSINLGGSSTLTVQQVGGIGLTLNGTSLSSLSIDPSSTMDLIFTQNSTPNWDFRWKDPSGNSNWISTIDGMIMDGEIKITSPDGYTVSDHNGYTWIQNGGAVPEPSSLLMLGLGSLGLLGVVAAQRRRLGA